MEVLLLKGRIKIRKLWNDLDEFKAEIRVLKNKKNKGKKNNKRYKRTRIRNRRSKNMKMQPIKLITESQE